MLAPVLELGNLVGFISYNLLANIWHTWDTNSQKVVDCDLKLKRSSTCHFIITKSLKLVCNICLF